MKSILSLWWMIFILPVPILGFILTFLPEKVIIYRAKVQKYMFRSFKMTNNDIDNSIYSSMFGENYSKRLHEQQVIPNKYKYQLLLIRTLGLFFIFIFIVMLFIVVEYLIHN